MHDVLAHSLSGLVLNLEAARLAAERGEAGPTGRGRHGPRSPAGQDRPGRSPTGDRDAAQRHAAATQRLAELAAEFEGDTGVACTFAVAGDEREVGSDGRLTLYRVAQEGLTNIRKHTCADRVEVRLAYETSGARLTIEDFQTGKEPPPPGGGTGYGLTGIRERAPSCSAAHSPPGPPPRASGSNFGSRMTGTICVIVVDDQRAVREGLAALLALLDGVEVVGVASDGEEALELAAELHPEVVLMDLRMPRCDGVEATRRLREHDPNIKVLMLTTYADDRSVIDALRAGAAAASPKTPAQKRSTAPSSNSPRVRPPSTQPYNSTSSTLSPPARPPPTTPTALPDGLTPREAEVLRLIAQGLSNSEIADRLVVNETTVKSHINHLFAKTGVRDGARAVTYAYRRGLA